MPHARDGPINPEVSIYIDTDASFENIDTQIKNIDA